VLELADVARPLASRQGQHVVRRHRGQIEAVLRGEAPAEVLHEQRNVAAALPQRRHGDDHRVEAGRADRRSTRHRLRAAVARDEHQSHVHRELLVTSDAA
jgi:hypothetical protein